MESWATNPMGNLLVLLLTNIMQNTAPLELLIGLLALVVNRLWPKKHKLISPRGISQGIKYLICCFDISQIPHINITAIPYGYC